MLYLRQCAVPQRGIAVPWRDSILAACWAWHGPAAYRTADGRARYPARSVPRLDDARVEELGLLGNDGLNSNAIQPVYHISNLFFPQPLPVRSFRQRPGRWTVGMGVLLRQE